MSWYTTGTVNLTNGSKTVIGVGTKWTNPLIGVCAGQMLILKTANTIEIYEIASVQSDTQLTLANQYNGASKTGVSYEIPTAPNVSIEALALRISEMLNYYQLQMNGWQSILTGTGDITLTAPDGRIVTIKSQRALTEAINNSIKKNDFNTMLGNPGFEIMPSGLIRQWGVVTLPAVGNYNSVKIDSITYYTNYHRILLPIAFPTRGDSVNVMFNCGIFSNQYTMFGLSATANLDDSPTSFTVAILSSVLGYVPTIHYQIIGH